MPLNDVSIDFDRLRRTGDPEVVFGQDKTPATIAAILQELVAAHPDRAVLATRIRLESIDPLKILLPAAEIDPMGRTATLGRIPESRGTVAVVTAGTSDGAVAAEVATTLKVFGVGVDRISDVGVAGIHRVLEQRERIMDADAIIVAAGMEGALVSVIGGLVGLPMIAVPTSVGYGTSFNGLAALLGMLNSCAPGVVVTNIDNGFGAAVHAARIVRMMDRGLRT